jgi:flagellar hook assembly protein FlgD
MSNTVTVSPVSSTSPAGIAATNQATNGGGQTLTQQDFLKIMVAQFTQQDPLSSGDSSGGSGTSDYVNQLMSMTNLTTMQTMSSQLTTSTGQQALALADSLHGATVEVTDANGNVVTGVVTKTSVDSTSDNVLMTINGVQYSSANLVSIDQTAAQTAAATTTSTTP